MLNISRELFTAWNEAGLVYCHWKSNEHLLSGLNGETDLDVLLSQDNKDEGENLLRRLDFMQCKSQRGSRYPDVDDWIGFDKSRGSLIHLHLHYSLVTGHKGMKEYSLPWNDLALRTRMLNKDYGVYTMEPNLEMVTLYTRIGLKADFLSLFRCKIGKFIFSNDTQREIDWLKKKIDYGKVRQILETYYKDEAGAILDIMKKEIIDAHDYLKLRKVAERVFNKSSRVRYFRRIKELFCFLYIFGINKKLRGTGSHITKKVPMSGRGLSIVFLGQDGAGKTTVTNELKKWWNWKLDVRYVYMGSGENYLSRKKALLDKIPNNGFLRPLKAVIGVIDIKDRVKRSFKNVKISEKYISKGGVVIFDRFPQKDYPGICDGPKIRRIVESRFGKGKISGLFYPIAKKEEEYINKIINYNPDIVFKLLLSPEESIRRKPKECLESVRTKHDIVKSMRFDSSDVYTIDATMPFEEELIMIKNIIWQHIRK